MLAGGYREMNGQNRIRIHQHLEIRAQWIGNLLGGAISFAKKTRPLTQGITIYFCPRRHHAGWIVLHQYIISQRPHFYITQVSVALPRLWPSLYLQAEKTASRTIFHNIRLALRQLLPCHYLHGAQAILIQIVGVNLFHTKRSIAIAIPTAAEI